MTKFMTASYDALQNAGWPIPAYCRMLVLFKHGQVLTAAVEYGDAPASVRWHRREELPDTDFRPFKGRHWAIAWCPEIRFAPERSIHPDLMAIMQAVRDGDHVYIDILGE